jgi:SAM-dependent methyltransferase
MKLKVCSPLSNAGDPLMKKNLPHDSVLQRAYDSTDKSAHYDNWASDYDADIEREGFVGPAQAANLLNSIVSASVKESAKVLDFGCGTGLVGVELEKLGFSHLFGVDVSERMIELAVKRGCYRSVRHHDLRTPLLDDVRYQAGICVGVCAFGPVNASHISHMTSVLDSGAPLVITVNGSAWDNSDWPQQLEDAQSTYGYTVEYIKTIPYLVDKEIDAKLLIIRNAELENTLICQPAEPFSDE